MTEVGQDRLARTAELALKSRLPVMYRGQEMIGMMPEGKIVSKILLGLTLGALILALGFPAPAQQPAKIPVIGFLGASFSTRNDTSDAFRQGMRDLGYVEGKNIVIESRFAEGKRDRLPALAGELVRLKVDVLVTGGGNATRAARKATSTIPIVMAQSGDPVADGFVASLARPGRNITGLSRLSPELTGKGLEILENRPWALPSGGLRHFDELGKRANFE